MAYSKFVRVGKSDNENYKVNGYIYTDLCKIIALFLCITDGYYDHCI